MSEYVIKVKNAVKRFKETCALDHVSLNFEKTLTIQVLHDSIQVPKCPCIYASIAA